MKGRPRSAKSKEPAPGAAAPTVATSARIVPLATLPAPPARLVAKGELGALAGAKWREAGQKLVDAKILTTLDLDALASYCGLWAVMAKASEDINDHGIKEAGLGTRKNPSVAILDSVAKHVRAYQEQLGLTLLGRQRLNLEDSGGKTKLLDDFLGRGRKP